MGGGIKKIHQLLGPNSSKEKLECQSGIQAFAFLFYFLSYPGCWVGYTARIKTFPSRVLEKSVKILDQEIDEIGSFR